MCLWSWTVRMKKTGRPCHGKRWARSKGTRVSAFITSIPIHRFLQAEHYYQDELWTLCISVNSRSHCFPGFLKDEYQDNLIWMEPVEVSSGASLWPQHLLRAGTASTVQRFSSGSRSGRSQYLQGRRLYSLSGQHPPVSCPQL